jgi:hypothetical protein
MFVIGVVMVIGTIWFIKEDRRIKRERKEWERKIRQSGIHEVDRMKG